MTGTIKTVVADRGYGFIVPHDGPDKRSLFFHCRSLIDLDFGEHLLEQEVEFDLGTTDRGPRAVAVRPAD